MPGENNYAAGVAVVKPKKTCLVLLSVLLGLASLLACILLGTTLYFAGSQRCSDINQKHGPGNASESRSSNFGALGDPSNLKEAERGTIDAPNANTPGWIPRVNDVRLPYTVIPLNYSLKLQANIYGPDVSEYNFNGSVTIRLECREPTNTVYVHAHQSLKVDMALIKLTEENNSSNLISNFSYDLPRQWYRIQLKNQLKVGGFYLLSFGQFTGPLSINLRGWYLSNYVENNITKYMATSQLQPTDARRVFPCWDEPAFKSIFQISLLRRNDFQTLSNMQMMDSKSLPGDWTEDIYHPTVNTSTYLLAFVVSQFESLGGLDAKGRNFTVWARPDLISAADYALRVGTDIINFFEQYFELDYPLDKADMLAVSHFAAGAMENWGLMIFREATLIWDPVSGTEAARQKVATVISHEIAHQWFGNLVTLNWWDDIWLNEGFATFVEYIGVAHAEPSWHMDEQFAVLQLQKVLFIDSLSTTHPVFMPVYHPDEINEIFDTISYNKGASILRMMEAFLGREVFRKGLKIYLSKHKFKNTQPVHLWDALTEANSVTSNDIDVHRIMNVWIKQAGYPLVTVKRLGGNKFQLSQERFLLGRGENETSSQNQNLWSIPVTYAAASENNTAMEGRILWMENPTLDIEMNVPEGEWYSLNLRQSGFYRVNYDVENWLLFIKTLETDHQSLPRLLRAQLIDDSFHISNQGSLNFEIFLNLSRYLRNEKDFVPLNSASRAFNYLYDMLVMHKCHEPLKRYIRHLIDTSYQTIDWNASKSEENHLLNLARQIIVSVACEAEHADCTSKSKMLFDGFMANPSSNNIPTSLTRTVYCTAIREGGIKEWDFLQHLRTIVLHEDAKYRILDALGCTRDFVRLRTYIRELIDDAISKSDDLELPASLSGNPIGLYVIYDTIKREWPLRNNSPFSPFRMILRAVEKRAIIIETLPILDELNRMNATLHREEDRVISRSINRILTQSKRDKQWLEKYADGIHDWLKKQL